VNITPQILASMVVIVVTMFTHVTDARPEDFVSDSTENLEMQKRSRLKLTARIHSLGVFGYGGMIANETPAFDLNVTYEGTHWGCFVFKAADLYDLHSHYNFTLALAYLKIQPVHNVTVLPYMGFAIDQTENVFGHDSDGMAILITTLKLSDKFSVEHCGRFSNTFIKTEWFDWLNRIRLLYNKDHVSVMIAGWHNNGVFDQSTYTSLGFSAGYIKIKVSEEIFLSTTLTGILMAANSDEAERSDQSGLSFTIAATMN
jgi:hypothetical protein